MARSGILDSPAALLKSAADAGVAEWWQQALIDNGFNTLGKLAYAISVPGQPFTDLQVRQFIESLDDVRRITVLDITAFKRIIFESQTFTLSSLKAAVSGSDEPGSKKLPQVERTARAARQRARLAGLDISGVLEPAHSLIDTAYGFLESDELRYIALGQCQTRQSEIMCLKPTKELHLEGSRSTVVVKESVPVKDAPLESDLEVYQALQRRGIAFDLVGLCTYSTYMQWISRLFNLMAAPNIPGYSKVSLQQVIRTDQQAFARLAELVNGSLKERPDGSLPLDAALEGLCNDSSVMVFMQPLPHKSASTAAAASSQPSASKPPPRADDHPAKRQKKGKGKGGKRQRDPVPSALEGCSSRTPEGKAICYNYNLKKCDAGDSCPRQHVCGKCFKKHPFLDHRG